MCGFCFIILEVNKRLRIIAPGVSNILKYIFRNRILGRGLDSFDSG
jgi:hypothetical protein